MKIKLLDAHDRLQHFTKNQSLNISECCQDLVNQRPFGKHAFYIFAHPRTLDDGVTKTLIWQPRLTKPKAQTNSMLFKAYPGTDLIKVLWMIPAREMWEQYQKGKLTESQIIVESIQAFVENREELELPERDDLTDSEICAIYESIARDAREKQSRKSKILKPQTLEAFPTSPSTQADSQPNPSASSPSDS